MFSLIFLCPRSYMEIWINTYMYMCMEVEKLPRKKRGVTGERRVRKRKVGSEDKDAEDTTHACMKLKNKCIFFLQTFLTFKMHLFLCAL